MYLVVLHDTECQGLSNRNRNHAKLRDKKTYNIFLAFSIFQLYTENKVRNVRSGFMELAKVTTKGQITIPVAIRKKLSIKDGDKLLFVEKPDGVIMVNPTMMALEKIGKAFEGEAERLGLENDDDVVAMIKEIRKENWEKNNADNA
jgi:AbrB family looped-hinge helix DNA binding protein